MLVLCSESGVGVGGQSLSPGCWVTCCVGCHTLAHFLGAGASPHPDLPSSLIRSVSRGMENRETLMNVEIQRKAGLLGGLSASFTLLH